MGRVAEQVYTSPEDVRRLERWVDELAVNARVALHLHNGSVTAGVVTVTPTVQIFHDPQQQEGINGVVKLIDPDRPDWSELVWLGDIARVEHLDSVHKGASPA